MSYLPAKAAREYFLETLAGHISEWILWSDCPEDRKASAYDDIDRALKFRGKSLPHSERYKAELAKVKKADRRRFYTDAKKEAARIERENLAVATAYVTDGGPDAKPFRFDYGVFSGCVKPNPYTATRYLAKAAALPVGVWKDLIPVAWHG